MKPLALLGLATSLVLGAGTGVAQQSVTVQFRDGRVTIQAQNAPVRQILDEWTRVGGTRIVNGDKVPAASVTLQLVDMPERDALEIVLQNVSGYLLGMRTAEAAGASAVDRILILPPVAGQRDVPTANVVEATLPESAPRAMPSAAVCDPGTGCDVGMVGQAAKAAPAPRPQQPASGDAAAVTGPVYPGYPAASTNGIPAPARPPVTMPPGRIGQPPAPVTTSPGNPFGVPRGSGAPGVVAPLPMPDRPRNPYGMDTAGQSGRPPMPIGPDGTPGRQGGPAPTQAPPADSGTSK
jgi:hypothetical protein